VAFGVFMHRTDSIYEDIPAERYQFPRQYLERAKACVGDWVVYLEPSKVRLSKGYFAVAQVQDVIADPAQKGMFVALIAPGSYLEFGEPVALRDGDDYLERGLLNDAGRLSGRAQAAIRPISPADFARIVERGLGREDDILPRSGAAVSQMDEPRAEFLNPAARLRAQVLMNRVVRDRNFRRSVLRAYGERCAVTGLRLINGGGRAEVEAAHIRPVEAAGPDIVSNGIALSGTVHWMFDRGLLGLGEDLTIRVSRQANDADGVKGLINPTGRLILPKATNDRPRPEFVLWHRENCFKQ
jgi:putative restriction endonuclease